MTKKYFKPSSVSWWSGIGFIAAGVFMSFEPVHGLSVWVDSFSTMFQGQSPGSLILTGTGIVGLRGAM